jgi:hypothetical protein
MFNLLAIVGTVISLLMAVASLRVAGGNLMAIVNLFIAALSFGLLYYSYTSGQYQRCYLATIFIIFFLGFAFLFFHGGGYRSALPSFFIFSTVFTVFMLEGWVMVAVAADQYHAGNERNGFAGASFRGNRQLYLALAGCRADALSPYQRYPGCFQNRVRQAGAP